MGRFAASLAPLVLLAAFAGPALAAPSTIRAVIHEDFGARIGTAVHADPPGGRDLRGRRRRRHRRTG